MFNHPDERGPRVWLVGRSALARAGLRALLQEQHVYIIGGSSKLEEIPPAEIVIGLDGPIHSLPKQIPILLIGDEWSRFPDNERVWGLLPSDSTPYEVYAAVIALHAGLCVMPPLLLQRSTTLVMNPVQEVQEQLTGREHEILQLVAQGLTNRQMAGQLSISEHTVKFHLSSIYSKLTVGSRTEAVRVGVQQGLIVL